MQQELDKMAHLQMALSNNVGFIANLHVHTITAVVSCEPCVPVCSVMSVFFTTSFPMHKVISSPPMSHQFRYFAQLEIVSATGFDPSS